MNQNFENLNQNFESKFGEFESEFGEFESESGESEAEFESEFGEFESESGESEAEFESESGESEEEFESESGESEEEFESESGEFESESGESKEEFAESGEFVPESLVSEEEFAESGEFESESGEFESEAKSSDTTNDTVKTNTPTIREDSPEKKSSIGIIIGVIAGVFILLVISGILIFIFRKKLKSIEIIFVENSNNRNEIPIIISKEKTISDLIKKYYKKKGTENLNLEEFTFKGKNILAGDNECKKIKDLLKKDSNSQVTDNYSVTNYKINISEKEVKTGLNSVEVIEINNNKNYIYVTEKELTIIFKESKDCNQIEIHMSVRKTIKDLFSSYLKERGNQNINEEIILYNDEIFDLEKNESKKIKELIKNPLTEDVLYFSVSKNDDIEIKFYEEGKLSLETRMSNEKKISDIIKFYYEKKNIKEKNKKLFLCIGKNISLIEKENITCLLTKVTNIKSIVIVVHDHN